MMDGEISFKNFDSEKEKRKIVGEWRQEMSEQIIIISKTK